MIFSRCIRYLALSAIGVTALPSQAAEFQIFYAEPIQLQAADVAGTATTASTQSPRRVSFLAYGRQFDLELEPNTRLLSRMAPERRRELSRYQLFRGRLTGVDDSWVRITRIGNELHGAIWDGTDLYTIAPASETALFTVMPLDPTMTSPVIYRASETETGLGANFCGVGSTQGESTALAQYQALTAELRSNVALATVPGNQIELAVIGDFEFFSRFQPDATGAALVRMNIVDGIFSEQVGVAIVVPEVTVFNTFNDPFTAASGEAVLDEVGSYRESTPQVRARGLAHLFTGRDFPELAGVAYVDALCEPFFGVGLTESGFDSVTSGLIAAHEIGHNFGARHDAEPGSPCESTPPDFLMAPTLGGTTFSQCSLDQIRPRVAAAACITRSDIADAEVVINPATINGIVGETLLLPIDVNSIGTGQVRDVVVNVSLTFPASIVSATVAGGTCSTAGNNISCQLGALDSGASRRIEIVVRPTQAGFFPSTARLTASNDRDASNDSAPVQFMIAATRDVGIALSAPVFNGVTRQPVAFAAQVRSLGSQTVDDVQVSINVGILPVSASAEGGTCALNGTQVACTLGSMPAGTSRRIDVSAVGTSPGQHSLNAIVSASNDGNPVNNFGSATIVLVAQRDASVQAATQQIQVQINQAFTTFWTIRSSGAEAIDNVIARVSLPAEIIAEAVTLEAGACIPDVASFLCAIGTLPAGATRRIDLRARATQVGVRRMEVHVQATDDDAQQNDRAAIDIDAKHASDVAVEAPFPQNALQGQPLRLMASLTSVGTQSANNVSIVISVPATFSMLNATLNGGSCSTSATSATCTLSVLPAGQRATVVFDVSGSQLGTFTGTVTAGAGNDADPGNNSASFPLTVVPFFDAGFDPRSINMTVGTDRPFDLQFTVFTATEPMSNVLFIIEHRSAFAVESMVTQAGSCASVSIEQVNCSLGSMPAGGSIRIDLRLRPLRAGQFQMLTHVVAPGDASSSNNFGAVSILALNPDVLVGAVPENVLATVNSPFAYADVIVVGGPSVENTTLDISIPASITIESMAADGGSCTTAAGGIRCTLGTVVTGPERHVRLTLRASQPGTFSSALTLNASNDSDASNNSRTVSLIISPASPPPDSGGGGGGGGLGLTTLAALLALATRRRRQETLGETPTIH